MGSNCDDSVVISRGSSCEALTCILLVYFSKRGSNCMSGSVYVTIHLHDTLRYATLLYFTLLYFTFHCIHYITSHYITLPYVTSQINHSCSTYIKHSTWYYILLHAVVNIASSINTHVIPCQHHIIYITCLWYMMNIHTCSHTHTHASRMHAYRHTCMHAHRHTYLRTYVHTDLHTYIHTYTHTHITSIRTILQT